MFVGKTIPDHLEIVRGMCPNVDALTLLGSGDVVLLHYVSMLSKL